MLEFSDSRFWVGSDRSAQYLKSVYAVRYDLLADANIRHYYQSPLGPFFSFSYPIPRCSS